MAVTPHQLHLLHHALGLRPDNRQSSRNHFVAGPGHHDQPDLEALEAAGLMKRSRPPAFCEPGDVVFRVTDAGREHAIEHMPPASKRTKYDDYMDSESGLSFAEWLGIRVPKVEWNREWGAASRYCYVRRDWYYRQDVAGEWKPTKKEAKASYKEALQRYQLATEALV